MSASSRAPGTSARAGLAWQVLLIAATIVPALAPPATGMMLVLPIVPARAGTTLDWVLPTGAGLVAPGPYRGAFVVAGARATLLPVAIAHGAMLVTARFSGCGA